MNKSDIEFAKNLFDSFSKDEQKFFIDHICKDIGSKSTTKLQIPNLGFLAQNHDGSIYIHERKPERNFSFWCAHEGRMEFVNNGKLNPNWKDTLIDLLLEDYEYKDGILIRIDKP